MCLGVCPCECVHARIHVSARVPMCVSLCVHVHVCLCVPGCLDMCLCVCVHVCMCYVHVIMCVCVLVSVCVHVHVCMCASPYVCMHLSACVHLCACVSTRACGRSSWGLHPFHSQASAEPRDISLGGQCCSLVAGPLTVLLVCELTSMRLAA